MRSFAPAAASARFKCLLILSDELKKHPKIFVGYSDITILLNWLRTSLRHGDFSRADGGDGLGARLDRTERANIFGEC